jgi:hypothetical protein
MLGRRCMFPLIYSANTDPELQFWLRWASEERNAPTFVRTVAQAALIACSKRMAGLLLVS